MRAPGYEEARAAAEWVIIDLIEQGARTLPTDFLEQQQTIPLYCGDHSPILTTEGSSAEQVAALLLAQIAAGKPVECDYAEGECSVCGKRAQSKNDYCSLSIIRVLKRIMLTRWSSHTAGNSRDSRLSDTADGH